MAVDYYFHPPTIEVPTLAALGATWSLVPNADVRKAIAHEDMYLHFHLLALGKV